MNVPIYANRLGAAVCEARYKVSQRRAEFEQRQIDIQYEVQAAYEQLEESRQTLALYHDRLIPAVEQNVSEARANYEVNKLSFLNLAQAQRQWIEMREKQQEALATYHRRLAELERIVASPLPDGEAALESRLPSRRNAFEGLEVGLLAEQRQAGRRPVKDVIHQPARRRYGARGIEARILAVGKVVNTSCVPSTPASSAAGGTPAPQPPRDGPAAAGACRVGMGSLLLFHAALSSATPCRF